MVMGNGTAKAVLSVAKDANGYLGVKGTDPPKSKYGEWYGINPGHWCAMFVSFCLWRGGNPIKIQTKKGFSTAEGGRKYFDRQGQLHGKNTTPKPGDIVFFDYNEVGEAHHCALVLKAEGPKDFTTIEGNTSNPNVPGYKNGNACAKKHHKSNRHVMGFGRPNYASEAETPQNNVLAGFPKYTVQSGDTLSEIAKAKLGTASRYKEIAELNGIPGPDYAIFVGQVLKLPNH